MKDIKLNGNKVRNVWQKVFTMNCMHRHTSSQQHTTYNKTQNFIFVENAFQDKSFLIDVNF
jgi:hypothetical protein